MMDTDGLMLNVSDLDLKKLSSQLSTQSPQQPQQQQSQTQQQQSKQHKRHQQHFQQHQQNNQITSVASTVTISSADDITSVHSLMGSHNFVSMGTNGTNANQQSNSLQQQQDSSQSFLQQQRNNSNSAHSAVAAATTSAIMVDELQNIQQILNENQKLSAIARICIHLVDRCRTLNKTKQFTEDLNKLGNMIDDFNRNNIRNNGTMLPSFSTAGLVFANGNGSTNNGNVGNSSSSSSNLKQPPLLGNNMLFIQTSANGHNPRQTLSISHFVTDEEVEAVQKLQQHHQQIQQQQQNESRNAKQHKQTNRNKQQNQHVVTMHHHQGGPTDSSILFKQLTAGGHLDLGTELTSGKEANLVSPSGIHHQSNQMLTIPININDQNALFSIVNQMDTSNIENTPNLNNKCKS